MSIVMAGSLVAPSYLLYGRLYAYVNQNQEAANNTTDQNVAQGWSFEQQ